jgi:DNA-binding NtrC family response regulator
VIRVDVRVLAATNKDIGKAVETGAFREDLYFRLAVFPIRSPALRERVEDIPVLAQAFMDQFANENGVRPKLIDEDVMRALAARKWPGNVRELKNVVERSAILCGERVTIADLPEDPHASPFEEEVEAPLAADPSAPEEIVDYGSVEGRRRGSQPPPAPKPPTLREHRELSERKYIVDTLRQSGWNISRTALVLGVERTNLHKKIRAYQIRRGES